MIKLLKKIPLAILCCTLVGCGFHLQRLSDLPTPLKNMYVQSGVPYNSFLSQLKRTLRRSGVKVRRDLKDADTILTINSSKLTHDSADINLSTQARVLTFTFSATINLKNNKGSVIIANKTLSSSHHYTLRPNEVLASSNQVEIARNELQRRVITKILYQLDSKQTREKLKGGATLSAAPPTHN